MTQVSVLYNADCPVCRREIDHYARISKAHSLPVRFDNLNDPDVLREWRIDKEQAAKRLHLRKGDQVFNGVPAFIALWDSLPRYRWLGKLVKLPGIHRLAVWTYDLILAPLLYWRHQKRVATSACGHSPQRDP
ncbi:hypothetical protein ROLI_030770 [Roseobacter fucihabitans]|uniref:Thiol-disulfide oxidoreductase n=1 Tax=Roseobacter fucihabitans TaxID=1537242 RepID=A0ABZ2BVA2_9RHOB|nr:DUF393 domain-containing protein [Roseobacter litoralis]MBC6968015.1 hypothetical protein [Roseobacter litoralis]